MCSGILAMVFAERYNRLRRAFARGEECQSRPGVMNDPFITRVDAASSTLSVDNADHGAMLGGFTCIRNCQLPYYISWRPDLFAVATDALWIFLSGYAFPPFCLVGKYLQNIRMEGSSIINLL